MLHEAGADQAARTLCQASHLPPPPKTAGLLKRMSGAGGATARLSASFGWYNASDGLDVPAEPEDNNRGQASSAYIFR